MLPNSTTTNIHDASEYACKRPLAHGRSMVVALVVLMLVGGPGAVHAQPCNPPGSDCCTATCTARANPNIRVGVSFLAYNTKCLFGGLGCLGDRSGCRFCRSGTAACLRGARALCMHAGQAWACHSSCLERSFTRRESPGRPHDQQP